MRCPCHWDAAIAAHEKSLTIAPYWPLRSYNWIFLAMAHWQQGEKDQAHSCYNRAVAETDQIAPLRDENAFRMWEMAFFHAEAEELMGRKGASAGPGSGR